MRRCFGYVAVILVLSGCATTYRYEYGTKALTSTNTSMIKKGQTTQGDIRALFGEPLSKSDMSDLGVLWTYTYTKSDTTVRAIGPTDRDIHIATICITFDRDGIVKDYYVSESNPPMNGTLTITR